MQFIDKDKVKGRKARTLLEIQRKGPTIEFVIIIAIINYHHHYDCFSLIIIMLL